MGTVEITGYSPGQLQLIWIEHHSADSSHNCTLCRVYERECWHGTPRELELEGPLESFSD